MPIRRSTAPSVKFDPSLFGFWSGIGNEPYFSDVTGYTTSAEAARAWGTCRRAVWGQTHRFSLPRAAEVHDRLSRCGWESLWRSWNHTTFDARPVLAALDADVAAVDAFERADTAGAAVIADFLTLWRSDLATLRTLTEACRAKADDWRARCSLGIPHLIGSAATYGGDNTRLQEESAR